MPIFMGCEIDAIYFHHEHEIDNLSYSCIHVLQNLYLYVIVF